MEIQLQNNNNSLKEYYVQLNKLSIFNTRLLNGLMESFNSYSPNTVVRIDDENNIDIRIPSFLYIENKINELESAFNSLFNLPKNGEAWFSKNSDMYKLNVIQSNLVPQTPSINYNEGNGFSTIDNNFFKDLVFPKTYLKLDISNITNNINELYIKKIVIHNENLIENIFDNNLVKSYNDVKEKLYLANEGVDYDEYDSKYDFDAKQISYSSKFEILDIVNSEYVTEENNEHYIKYEIRVNTLEYYSINDSSIAYKLQEGEYISLSHNYNIFKILNINEYVDYDSSSHNKQYIITIKETNGHTTLNTIENDESMYFVKYVNDSDIITDHINIPIEENPYIVIFVSSIYNNIMSEWSNGIFINLNNVFTTDNNGARISYIDYYHKYCKNIGDIITNIANLIYIQPNMLSHAQLKELTTGKELQELVTNTLYNEDKEVLSISVINEHLVDDEISNNLSRLYKQKIEITNNLFNITNNINDTFNQLINTNFSETTSVTQEYLKSKLDSYYGERLSNQQQLISIVNNIDLIKNDIVGVDSLKYRIRGITNVNEDDELDNETSIVSYIHSNYGFACDIIGLEIEYKYKNIRNNSTTITNNDNTVFSDWIKVINNDKQRYLKFDKITNDYTIEYINYNNNTNIVKWNQIDIPIRSGEDVIIRIRYKYNIGQPFINLYTPWSNNITISYNPENSGSISDISTILSSNEGDIYTTKILNELINGGYQEHMTNKIIDNSQIYYHMPENIYSGFNTAENKFISLKDKLISMSNEINEYKEYIDNESKSEYKVFLQDGEQLIEINKNTLNNINIQNENTIYDSFIRKDLNIVIKNTGTIPINLYSIFPGNTDIPLIHSDIDYYIENKQISDYERVPLLLDNIVNIKESIFPQVLGQWIYFRYNNIYTNEYLYNVNTIQNINDTNSISNGENPRFDINVSDSFISNNNSQMLLGYRNRFNKNISSLNVLNIDFKKSTVEYNNQDIDNNYLDNNDLSKFIYNNSILKYEHIVYINNDNNTKKYLDENTSITDLLNNPNIKINNENNLSFANIYGAFLIPQLLAKSQIICDNDKNNQFKKLNVGESISIPLLLEYYLDNNSITKIHKTIAFSLLPSLTKNIDNYIIKVNIANNVINNNSNNIEYIPQISTDII